MVGDDGLFEVDVTAREDTTLTAMSGIASKVPVWKYQNIEISKSQQLIVRALLSATKSSINKHPEYEKALGALAKIYILNFGT